MAGHEPAPWSAAQEGMVPALVCRPVNGGWVARAADTARPRIGGIGARHARRLVRVLVGRPLYHREEPRRDIHVPALVVAMPPSRVALMVPFRLGPHLERAVSASR